MATGSNFMTSDASRISYALQGTVAASNVVSVMDTGQIDWLYNVSQPGFQYTTQTNNGILTLNTGSNQYHQLGFSSNGNIYHQTANQTTSSGWKALVIETGTNNINSQSGVDQDRTWMIQVDEAYRDADHNIISDTYLKLSGGVMTGPLTINKLFAQNNISYGTTLPLTPTEGQVFFQISDPWYELPPGGTAGQALVKRTANDRDVEWGAVGGIMRPNATSKYYVTGSQYTTENTDPAIFNTQIYVENSVLMGAAWNDYAEYRKCNEKVEPGRCIVENGDGSLSLSTKRLQQGAEIISDTFGFAIGKTNESNVPIAVSGRVLAYMNEDLKDIKIGAPVCSGPNGTVSQMTKHEARKYPWLIIGTISSIPQEEEWGQNKIKVNNRVWIRVR